MDRVISRLKLFGANILSRYYKWNNIKVILIVGTGRTGTEFLAKYIEEMDKKRIFSAHEPYPDLLKLSVDIRKKNLTNKRITTLLSRNRLNQLLTIKKKGIKIYVESNNNLSFLLPYLKNVFRNVKVLFFTRNPEDFLFSEMNKKHGKAGFYIYSKSDKRKRINAILMNDEPHNYHWNNWCRQYKIVWYWKYCNDFILKHINNYEHKIVKYEDFFSSQEEIKRDVFDFIGLKSDCLDLNLFKKRKNASKESIYNALNQFDDEFIRFFEENTSELKHRLKY